METLSVIHMFLTWLALIVAFIALAFTSTPYRTARQLRASLNEIETRHDTLEGRVKKLNANHALMLARQVRAAEEELPAGDDTAMRQGETPADWKARMRELIRKGKLHHAS